MTKRPHLGPTPYSVAVSGILRRERVARGVQQGDLAKRLGMLQPAFSRIERGETVITVQQLRVVAHHLGISMSGVLDEAESAHNS